MVKVGILLSLLISGQKVSKIASKYDFALFAYIFIFRNISAHWRHFSLFSRVSLKSRLHVELCQIFSASTDACDFFSFILKYFYWFVNVTPDLLSTTKSMQSLNVIFSMDYCIWLTNMLLLFRFLHLCTWEKSD